MGRELFLTLAALAIVIACEQPKAMAPLPHGSATTIAIEPPPPIAVRDAGHEAATPTTDKNKVGSLHIIARSQGTPFHMYRLGGDIIVRAGKSVAKVSGDELVPLPTFFDGIPTWTDLKLAKDKAFDAYNTPAGPRDTWTGHRRVLDIVGKSEGDVFVVTERGDYQMWVGEVWRRTGASPFKLARDLANADRTFAGVALGKNDSLLGLVHPYADNLPAGAKGTVELYRLEVVGNAPRLQLAKAPKDCFTHVSPGGLVAFPTGEAMLYGQRCYHLDPVAVVSRWDERGNGPTVDTLPPRGSNSSVSLDGALALAPRDVWLFGGAMLPQKKDHDGDLPTKAYLAHWDGAKWSMVAAPDAGPITHLVRSADGSLVAYVWPEASFKRDASGRWTRTPLDKVMEDVRGNVWFGPADDLFIAGRYDKGNVGVVLHSRPAKQILEVNDEDPYD